MILGVWFTTVLGVLHDPHDDPVLLRCGNDAGVRLAARCCVGGLGRRRASSIEGAHNVLQFNQCPSAQPYATPSCYVYHLLVLFDGV